LQHDSVAQFLGLLVVILGSARLIGILSRLTGQPAVLGELLAGVILGPTLLGWVDPQHQVLKMLGQIGVVLLMFQIGMETDLRKLMGVWGPALAVAIAGILLPLGFGYGLCRSFGLDPSASLATGAVLSVTGIGVTARILADLGRLQDLESQIVLGAAVIDDMVGLVLLGVVGAAFEGETITIGSVALMTATAVGFLVGTLWLGARVIPPAIDRLAHLDLPGSAPVLAVVLAFALAWLAVAAGSAVMIGAFAAGLLLRRSSQAVVIEVGLLPLGRFFVPIFFVMVGATVNLRLLNPATSEHWMFLLTTFLLFLVAVLGKLAAGYAPFWFPCRKAVIGWAMVPRGAVGLVFAQFGLAKGVLDERLFSAITLMVILTTMLAPPIMRWLLPPQALPPGSKRSVAGELVSEP
jgi:Kef-type K+ transport system membrane component KefB